QVGLVQIEQDRPTPVIRRAEEVVRREGDGVYRFLGALVRPGVGESGDATDSLDDADGAANVARASRVPGWAQSSDAHSVARSEPRLVGRAERRGGGGARHRRRREGPAA